MAQLELDADGLQRIVAQLGGAERLVATARGSRAFLRPRGVRTALDLLRLALLYGPGRQSLRTLAANAAASGIANVSDVALLNRLKQAADWLETLCAESLGGIASDAAAGEERPLRIVDGSRLAGPAASAWRLHLAYDPRAGRITGARITTLEQGERLDRLPVRPGEIRPGEIRLGDRGFPKPAGIRDVLAAGADLLVRLSWKSLRLTDAADQPLDWFALFDGRRAPAARRGGPIARTNMPDWTPARWPAPTI